MRTVLAVVCLSVCACTRAADAPQTGGVLRITRTTVGELGPAFKHLSNIKYEVVSEGGSSITSLVELLNNKIDVSIPVADVAYLAYAGQLDEIPKPFDQLRGMAVVGFNALHLLVAPNVDARSVHELRGLHVSMGPPGSSTALIAERLLQAHGIPIHSIRAEKIPNQEMLKLLPRGAIDAAFVGYNPGSSSAASAMAAGARLVPLAGSIVEDIRTQYPYLKRMVIPANTYPNQPAPVHTIGVDTVMACRADLDEDVVYRLLDAYFAAQPATMPVNFERAPATPIPLHPGAARYYRQRELTR
jgi:TRAP transporter TAXI family solute receptor